MKILILLLDLLLGPDGPETQVESLCFTFSSFLNVERGLKEEPLVMILDEVVGMAGDQLLTLRQTSKPSKCCRPLAPNGVSASVALLLLQTTCVVAFSAFPDEIRSEKFQFLGEHRPGERLLKLQKWQNRLF